MTQYGYAVVRVWHTQRPRALNSEGDIETFERGYQLGLDVKQNETNSAKATASKRARELADAIKQAKDAEKRALAFEKQAETAKEDLKNAKSEFVKQAKRTATRLEKLGTATSALSAANTTIRKHVTQREAESDVARNVRIDQLQVHRLRENVVDETGRDREKLIVNNPLRQSREFRGQGPALHWQGTALGSSTLQRKVLANNHTVM